MKKDLNSTKEQLSLELNELRNRSKEREEMQEAANQQLKERLKELDCFYGISKIVEIPDISLEEIFRRTVKLIPDSWQYPEIAVCRIILDGIEYKTQNFKKTKWSQSSDIIVDGKHIGNIEVCYLKEMPDSDEGPFLKEEKLLLDALAERLGRIIERNQAEEALHTSEEKYNVLSNNMIIGLVLHNANTEIIFSNSAASTILGLSKEQMLGKSAIDPAWSFCRKDGSILPLPEYPVNKVVATNKSINEYIIGIKVPGRDFISWVSVNGTPVFDNNSLSYVTITFSDITERIQAEEKQKAANQQLRAANQQLDASNQQLSANEQQLRAANNQLEANNQQLAANEQQLRAANQQLIAGEHELKKEKIFSEKIVETANAIIIGVDKDHITRIFNKGAEDITGYTKAEVIGKDWFKLFFPKGMLDEMNKVWKDAWGISSHSNINSILSKKGKEIIVSWQNTGMYESEDVSKHLLLSIGEDITERKQSEDNLLKSEEKFRSYIENAPDGVFIVNQKGKFIEVNQAACEITEYTENELLELTIPELHHQEYLEKAKKHFQAVVKDGFAKDELGYVTKSGEKKFWNIDAVKLSDTHFLGFAKDITERKLTEEKLKESESRFNRISANANEVIFKINTQKHSYELITENVVNILGYSAQEFYNNPALGKQIICEDDIIRVELLWNNMLKYGISQQFECSMIHKSGRVVWLHQNNVIVKDDEGVITAIEGSFYDITERKQAEEALRESKERLNQAQAIGHVGAWDWNPNTGNLIWSEETFSILGLSSQKDTPSFELFLDLIHEEDRQDIEQAVEAALRDGQPYDVDCRIVRRNGSECVTNARGKVLFDDGGKPIQMIGTFQDITERKLAEDALRKSEMQFKNLFNSNRDGYIIVMGDGEILDANPRLSDMLGYSKDELIKRNFWKLTQEKWSEWELNVQGKKLLEQSYTDLYEKEYIRKDNSVFPVEIQAFILEKGKDIESTKIGAFVRDITERKQAEKALIDSESNLRQIIDLVPHFIFVKDEVGKFQIVNKAVAVAYGVAVEDIIGKSDMDFASNKDDAANFLKDDLVVINSRKQKFIPEEQITDSKGNIRFLETTKIPFKTSMTERRTILGVSVDITERKLAEKTLQENEKKFREIIENTRDIHYRQDFETGAYNYISPSIEHILGYTTEEIINMDVSQQENLFMPEDLPIAKNFREDLLSEDTQGEGFLDLEFRLISKSNKICWMNGYYLLSRDSDGNPKFIVGILTDITERKQSEEELRKSEAQKQALLDGTTDMIIHIDTNLQIIWANETALTAKPDVVGMTCYKGYIGREKPCEGCPALKAIQSGQAESGIMYHAAAEGVQGESYWELIGVPMKDEAGNITGAIEIARNITDRKQSEEALKKRMNELEIFNEATVGRELKMIELKIEINELLTKTGQKPKYEIPV